MKKLKNKKGKNMDKIKHDLITEELTKQEKIEIITKYYSKESIFDWMLDNEIMDGTESQNTLKFYILEHIDELWDQIITN